MKKTIALLMVSLLATAQAADVPPEPETVDVEIFQGPHILQIPKENAYPRGEVLDGREGWVQLNMMIDTRGKPYEVTVVDSSGNAAFEKAAVNMLNQTSFEPAHRGSTAIDSSYTFKVKFAIDNLANGASEDFVSAFRLLNRALEAGDKDKADRGFARLKPQNLYEYAFTNYARFFYDRKWGTPAQQLADLRLAIAGEDHPEYLPKGLFTNALVALFTLEVDAHDYGSALYTWDILKPLAPPATRDLLLKTVNQIRAVQAGTQVFRMPVTLDKGTSWNGTLLKNRFSIDVKSGAVSEIKLRCAKQFLFFKYEPGVEYSIGSKKDRCGIEVVGDPGTMFDVVQ